MPAPPLTAAALYRSPNALAPEYSRFRVAERLLLTGHSHQAWPDAGLAAQEQAWLDAAALVDEKWGRAEEEAERVRAGWRRLLGEPKAEIALGQNTHELVVRLLSALPLAERPRLLTTDAEFHTIRRQLDRLAEAGVEVVRVAGRPVDTLASRLAAAIDDRTAGCLVSSVQFDTASIVPRLGIVAGACLHHGAVCLIDAYHHLNVVPFDVTLMGLESAFITGGGYKYCQLGEGNCFLRVPPGCTLRPVITGWFAEFAALDRTGPRAAVDYGTGAARFAGATYDPTAHYRAGAVFAFHQARGLTPGLLREVSRHQVGRLHERFEQLGVDPAVAHVEPVPPDQRAGFLAIRAPQAAEICRLVRTRGVLADARGDVLRLGPAPYLTDDQLDEAIARLGEAVGTLTT
ncbi:MAG: kynureninase [Acidobacteriota bacterium]|nr:kynureninase [Acidobacteriota bacterium]